MFLFSDLSIQLTWPVILVGYLSVFTVAISKSGFGGALGALAAPIMLFVLPPRMALAVLLPLFLLSDFWAVWIWRKYGVRRIIMLMGVFGILGQMAGWLVFDYINDDMLAFLIGVVAIIVVIRYIQQEIQPVAKLAEMSNLRARQRRALRQKPAKSASVWMSLSGFSSFVSLTGGIPAQIFLVPFRLPRKIFLGTMSWYFLIINFAKVPFFTELDMFTAETLALSRLFLPIVPAGIWLGKWLVLNLSDKLFYHLVHVALAILGLRLMLTFGPLVLSPLVLS